MQGGLHQEMIKHLFLWMTIQLQEENDQVEFQNMKSSISG